MSDPLVYVGKPLTFTDDELRRLLAHTQAASTLIHGQRPGWRVLWIQEITHINRIIHHALERGHS